jgi:hypothetical protein
VRIESASGNGVTVPPSAGIRNNPLVLAKTISPREVQVPPRKVVIPATTSPIATDPPPRIDVRRSCPPTRKATHSPSGEKKGNPELSVPASGVGWGSARFQR